MQSVQFWKTFLLTILLLGMMSVTSFAQEAPIPDELLSDLQVGNDDEIHILCVGNSILRHGNADNIGWHGDWGMAASAEDKDYYHLLQKKVADAGFTGVSWSRTGIAPFERCIAVPERRCIWHLCQPCRQHWRILCSRQY